MPESMGTIVGGIESSPSHALTPTSPAAPITESAIHRWASLIVPPSTKSVCAASGQTSVIAGSLIRRSGRPPHTVHDGHDLLLGEDVILCLRYAQDLGHQCVVERDAALREPVL